MPGAMPSGRDGTTVSLDDGDYDRWVDFSNASRLQELMGFVVIPQRGRLYRLSEIHHPRRISRKSRSDGINGEEEEKEEEEGQ